MQKTEYDPTSPDDPEWEQYAINNPVALEADDPIKSVGLASSKKSLVGVPCEAEMESHPLTASSLGGRELASSRSVCPRLMGREKSGLLLLAT